MTASERRDAITALIAHQLEDARKAQGLIQGHIAHGRLSERTVWAIFNGHDHYVSTLAELADAMGCELVIEIRPQHLTDTRL